MAQSIEAMFVESSAKEDAVSMELKYSGFLTELTNTKISGVKLLHPTAVEKLVSMASVLMLLCLQHVDRPPIYNSCVKRKDRLIVFE